MTNKGQTRRIRGLACRRFVRVLTPTNSQEQAACLPFPLASNRAFDGLAIVRFNQRHEHHHRTAAGCGEAPCGAARSPISSWRIFFAGRPSNWRPRQDRIIHGCALLTRCKRGSRSMRTRRMRGRQRFRMRGDKLRFPSTGIRCVGLPAVP